MSLRLLLLLSLIFSPSCTRREPASKLVVYTYDSFVGRDSLGSKVAGEFRRRHGVDVEYVVFPDAGQTLNQVVLEGPKTRADVVVGIDGSLLERARKSGAFAKLDASVFETIPERLRFDAEHRFVPFDYGFLAILYDSSRTIPPKGMTLRQFAREPKYAKKVALQDPRTSSIGLGFLLWTQALYPGSEFDSFWKDMAGRARTLSPGWSAAYALFTKREVDFVVSYTTSPAYHVEKERNSSIRALDLEAGSFRQIESVGVVAGSKRSALARQWVETLLSLPVQSALPTLQWMYPAREGVELPASFKALPVPSKAIDPDPLAAGTQRAEWLKRWTSAMAGTR